MSLYWELAMLLPENRIMGFKVRFFYHVIHLNKESLAYRTLIEQKKNRGIPSLTQEVNVYLAMLDIKEEEVMNLDKSSFKRLLKDKLEKKNRDDIIQRMKRYKKINYLDKKEEPYGLKDYFKTMKLEDCRTLFSMKCLNTKSIKSHQMSNKEYARDLWSCPCGAQESIGHLTRCYLYAPQRENKDLEEEDQLVQYLQEVLKLRAEANLEH